MRLIKEDRFYLFVVLLMIMVMAVRTPLDTDMWWHLRAGEATWLDKEVYSIDTFSYTREGTDWINHSWLSQLLMYAVYSLGGFYALAIWVGLCAVISLGLVYPQMDGHPLFKGAVLLFAGVVASVVWSARPQLHSLVLFSLLSLIIYNYRNTKNWKVLLLIPPLFTLWGNLHGGYVLGLILILTVVSGELLNKVFFRQETLDWIQILFLLGAGISGFLFVLINPFGLEMWKIPFNTVGVETLQNLINEWASPDFHYLFQQPMTWMMLGAFSLMALSGKKADGVEVVSLAAFSWSALIARRNFGPFALVAAPIFARYLGVVINDWAELARDHFPKLKDLFPGEKKVRNQVPVWVNNLVNVTAIGLLLFTAGWKVVYAVRDNFEDALHNSYPVGAVEWLRDNPIDGNLFNDYNWGGYLIWHLRNQPVFVDGRTDLFGDEVLGDYLKLMSADIGWEKMIDFYQINTVLIREDSDLALALICQGWEDVYRDTAVVILQR